MAAEVLALVETIYSADNVSTYLISIIGGFFAGINTQIALIVTLTILGLVIGLATGAFKGIFGMIGSFTHRK